MREQVTGRILSAWVQPLGSTLEADAAVSDTTLTVDDASPFNDDGDGGWLLLGEQVIEYTDVDDDTGIITLGQPVTTLVPDGEDVYVWSDLYAQVDTVQYALVVVDGKDHNDDPLQVTVSDTISELANGDRGRPREACVIERDGDEWVMVRVPGRPSAAAAGHKWEADDVHTVTALEVTAGTVSWQLSHIPVEESVDARWRTVPQEPTEYSVDYATGVVTWPLSGFEADGDRLWVHYEYRDGIVTDDLSLAPERVHLAYAEDELGPGHSVTIPGSVPVGSFFVMAGLAWNSGTITSSDPRIDGSVSNGTDSVLWYGTLRTVGGTNWDDPLTASSSSFSNYAAVGVSFYEAGVVVVDSGSLTGSSWSVNPAPVFASSQFVVVAAIGSDGTVVAGSINETGTTSYTKRGEARSTKGGVAIFDWAASVAASNPASNFVPSGGTAGYTKTLAIKLGVAP